MGVPSTGELFTKLIHHIREAQNCALMISHIEKANDEDVKAKGWSAVGAMLGGVTEKITSLAARRFQ